MFLQSMSNEIRDNKYKSDLVDSEVENILYNKKE